MIRSFGTTRDGAPVRAVTLGPADGLQAEVLTYGGILRHLSVPGPKGRRNLVLGLPDVAAYENDPAYLGCLVGRYGNRIANARYTYQGRTVELVPNEGVNQLHGGPGAYGRKVWRLQDFQGGADSRLVLGLTSPDGENGFPGTLEVTAEITISGGDLTLRFTAIGDADTPVSLTWHPYFNLAGDPQVAADRQMLRLRSQHFLPVGPGLIPTGALEPVAGTAFDFRRPRLATPRHNHPQIFQAGGYDHCFVLDREDTWDEAADWAATLSSPDSGVSLRLHTDQPSVQFYGGQGLASQYPDLGMGVCLEPQAFPDAPNHPSFPDTMLKAGDRYSRMMRFSISW
ncbi:aldose epimerase family protein [Nitrospirillum amazonense]|uniref:aldose epimerase family protein n=1 Tax=Nitrospirillum amazonense TaxID=28077 RepID=UPI002DD42761|nr:aldose epimerase family protein [Nitrospirillum amazonense]MEC4594419.1 aldose epimerase family protein [Nitrospirillum amazonense]